MFEYIFTGLIAVSLLLVYLFITKPGIVSRILTIALRRDNSGKRNKRYMERFHEHKQSGMSRNIVIQILPFFGVLAFMFILGNQYFVFATVLSGSMVPTFEKGDFVLMQTVDLKVKVGDIVMFPMYGIKEPITHRVVGISEKGKIITKGDANPTADGSFPPEQIAGKAVLIGSKPIVLKGMGYVIRPEKIGEFTIQTKLPKSFVLAQAFNQFRAVTPLIIFFATIFYFFILIDTRMGENRRFGNVRRSKIHDKKRAKSQ